MSAQQIALEHWYDHTPWAMVSLPILGGIVFAGLILFVISRASGWSLLARRFESSAPFYGESWGWQSVRFRQWCGYNHCVTVGASPEGVYLAVQPPLRLFNPPLLIPWTEIEVEMGRKLLGIYETVQFRMGCEERVTMTIFGKLVERVRNEAGTAWPLYRLEKAEKQRW